VAEKSKAYKMNEINRRSFVKKSGVAAGTTLAASMIPWSVSCSNPSERIGVALVGCKNMGFTDLKAFLDEKNVECIALCDIDKSILDEKVSIIEKLKSKRPQAFTDFRKLLELKEVDVVIIGTPDHWHALIMIMALEAGKHVYVEKPMGHSIEECLTMVKAAAKFPKQQVQVGMWQRSSKHWFDASDYVRSGKLGDVNLVRAWIYKGMGEAIPAQPDSVAPEYVDYDMWLGPAPKRPFNKNRFHYDFRWFWDYAGGAMTDWGVHLLDFAVYGMNAGYPDSVSPGGGCFLNKGVIETPDIQQALYNYPTHTMIWECGLIPRMGPYGMHHGVSFTGTKGTLIVSRDGWQVNAEVSNKDGKKYIEDVPHQPAIGGLKDHVQNFLNAIQKGEKLNAPVEVGALTAIISEMGNIAYRAGSLIHWDAQKLQFREEAANNLAKLTYREPWKLPVL
jgi:predicted dehydrogenase